MFKKTKIAAAVLAIAATSSAQAVHIDSNGTGQVLLFPYYNVNENFQTSFNITNTTNKFKAVKIRLRESRDSNDVLDYNIYMSPWDQYTATIKMVGPNPVITSADTTCTFPSAPQEFKDGVALRNAYADVTPADLTEGYIEIIEMGDIADGPDNPNNTLNPGAAADGGKWAETGEDGLLDGNPNRVGTQQTINTAVVTGLKHADSVPVDCTVVARAWATGQNNSAGFSQGHLVQGIANDISPNDPYDIQGFNNGLVAPSGGLSGFSILLQTTTGAAFVADATAIDNYSTVPQHFLSHDEITYLLPSLASGNVSSSTITPESNSSAVAPVTVNNWPTTRFDTGLVDNLQRSIGAKQVPSGANPLPMAAALAATGFSNDYFIDPSLDGGTDWVVTLPMKKHGIYNGLTLNNNADGRVNANGTPIVACAPATRVVTNGQAQSNGIIEHTFDKVPAAAGKQCKTGLVTGTDDEFIGYTGASTQAPQGEVTANFRHWNREESEAAAPVSGSDFSPPKAGATVDTLIHLTREVNVNAFNNDSGTITSALGTPTANLIAYPTLNYTAGWGKLTYTTGYDLARNDQIEILVDGDGNTGNGVTNTIADNQFGIDGVPSMGFAAIKAVVGGNKAGETVPHVRYIDADGPSN